MSNTQTVQQMYADFGQGNVSGILAVLDPDAEWIIDGPSEIPYAGHRRGTAQIQDFFDTIYRSVEVTKFEPREFVAEEDEVIVFGGWGGMAKATGRDFETDWVQRWRFRNGKVTYFRGYEDTARTAAAFQE